MASLCSPKAGTLFASSSSSSVIDCSKSMMVMSKKSRVLFGVGQRMPSQFLECTTRKQRLCHTFPGSLLSAAAAANHDYVDDDDDVGVGFFPPISRTSCTSTATPGVRLGARRGGVVRSNGDGAHHGWKRLLPLQKKTHSIGDVRSWVSLTQGDVQESAQVETGMWRWEGHSIRYMRSGDSGPILLLVHGFGANCEHWRKNVGVLGQSHRVYALDLLGYGLSDKPDPRAHPPNSLYSFDTWTRQCLDFLQHHVAQGPAFIICNSIGGVAGLQAAVDRPEMVKGVVLLNISLRMLHVRNQNPIARPFIRAFQNTLRTTPLGPLFFNAVAKPQAVANILRQAYHDKSAVTEELVEAILRPGLMPGAVDVFLDFISYSAGPLPQDLLPLVQCPVLIGWGDKDPWEPIELGRAYQHFDCVQDFVVLPNVGHCPQDEAPHLVNPLIQQFVAQHTANP